MSSAQHEHRLHCLSNGHAGLLTSSDSPLPLHSPHGMP